MKIIYTHTDEAPALATRSLLPIIRAYAAAAGIELELRDISLAGRILAQFPDRLSEDQRVPDALGELGELVQNPKANVIKLPNVSASVPQLKAAISELQEQGFPLPDYPEDPSDEEQKEIRARYDKVKGSAVNPVLRQGNSDRRASASVKEYARQHPHSMGAWSSDSQSHVSTMSRGDFRSEERSVTAEEEGEVRIEHVGQDGQIEVLRDEIPVLSGEILDAAVMRRQALLEFFSEQIQDAKDQGVLFSVHLKATMMRVSDPIIFGHTVRAFFPRLMAEYGPALAAAGGDPDNGLAAILQAAQTLPEEQRLGVEAAIQEGLAEGPRLAMVDSA
ncbi:MAG: NADP-dependent isocitrate dehydrogenase, partial [Solirubrobacterales bacterium]|nr:NADP-dependent isocitrate dehydrogenase [Solirubrobacterales bacterium]